VNTSFKMMMLMSNKRQTWMMMRMMMIWKIHKRGDHRLTLTKTSTITGHGPFGSHPVCTHIALSEYGRILAEPNFRFFLLHHQSLWDAMVYSEFVATKLQLSTARGMHHLRELLALMGFPLEDCEQPYSYTNPPLKRRLAAQLETYAPQYGLDHVTFTSFFCITGYQSLLSATDMSYALAVLLENVVTFL